MAKTLLDRIKSSLTKQGIEPRTVQSRDWLKNKIKELKPTQATLMSDRKRLKDSSIIGKMYFYFYDPKTKDSMPYYDRFPLVIPIERYKDGFLGLNLHYIHPRHRVNLLDKLSEIASNKNYDEKTKLRISYGYLAASSRAFEATPCIKRYLFSHVVSNFQYVNPEDWDKAIMLPTERFVGKSKDKVWADSMSKI